MQLALMFSRKLKFRAPSRSVAPFVAQILCTSGGPGLYAGKIRLHFPPPPPLMVVSEGGARLNLLGAQGARLEMKRIIVFWGNPSWDRWCEQGETEYRLAGLRRHRDQKNARPTKDMVAQGNHKWLRQRIAAPRAPSLCNDSRPLKARHMKRCWTRILPPNNTIFSRKGINK